MLDDDDGAGRADDVGGAVRAGTAHDAGILSGGSRGYVRGEGGGGGGGCGRG